MKLKCWQVQGKRLPLVDKHRTEHFSSKWKRSTASAQTFQNRKKNSEWEQRETVKINTVMKKNVESVSGLSRSRWLVLTKMWTGWCRFGARVYIRVLSVRLDMCLNYPGRCYNNNRITQSDRVDIIVRPLAHILAFKYVFNKAVLSIQTGCASLRNV